MLYLNEFSAFIPQFTADLFAHITINGNFEFCPGVGYEYEEIDATVNFSMKFNDCYKNILTDLCEFNQDWRSANAKWLDECDLSNDSLINLVDRTLVYAYEDLPYYGTVNPTSVEYCYSLPYVG